jgi:hypothetical protein
MKSPSAVFIRGGAGGLGVIHFISSSDAALAKT